MNEDFLSKLIGCIGSAISITDRNGNSFQAGIHNIDEKNRIVQYLNSKGLKELRDAQSENLPVEFQKKILLEPENYSVISIDEIKEFTAPIYLLSNFP